MRINRMLIIVPLLLAMGSPFALAAPATRPASAVQSQANVPDTLFALRGMIGKPVLGKSREFLGTLAAIDGEKRTANMKIPTGATVALPTEKLAVEEDHVRAASVSRGDVLVMVRETGQQGTLEAGVLPNPFKK